MWRMSCVQETGGGKMWTVSKEFRFEAAHSLPNLPETHKCHHLHGHSYTVRIHCSGHLVPDKSWVVDYADIKELTQPLIESLDHKNINDVILIATTAENISFWFYRKLFEKLPVSQVDVEETPGTCCSYRPEH